MKKCVVFVCLVPLFFLDCNAKINGTLQVDGKNFAIEQCRSGQAFGFNGIELVDATKRRLRLFANPDGSCAGAIFNDDSLTGDRLDQCGTLTMQAQSSRINSINNVKGTARLSCNTGTHKVAGSVDFENCR